MQTKHIIIIAVVAAVILIGVVIGVGIRSPMVGGSVGVIEITGIIHSPKHILKDLKTFGDDPSIKAIILRINSPGGVVAASQEIYDMVKRQGVKKPIISSMESVAASGAYYLALPSDVIVANPGTITGSIGVIMEWPVLEKLLQKIGIEFETVKSKEHKDIGSSYRRMNDRERQLMERVVTDVYDQFVAVTAEHRMIPVDSVARYADGRVFTGGQAKALGFIDTLGSFETAVEIAGDMVGIERPHLIYPPKRISFIDLFVEPMEHLLLPKLYFVWR
ncbi:MAG: signal peptide peptidase SppA [candidate division WOR-3 bacterium]|nr:MAG: signal peptide peptidase SppA [candidate division WOR-3 bacterium]